MSSCEWQRQFKDAWIRPSWELTGGWRLIRKGRQVWSAAGQTSETASLGEHHRSSQSLLSEGFTGNLSHSMWHERGAHRGREEQDRFNWKDKSLSAHRSQYGPRQLLIYNGFNISLLIILLACTARAPIGSNQTTNHTCMSSPPPLLYLKLFSHHDYLGRFSDFIAFSVALCASPCVRLYGVRPLFFHIPLIAICVVSHLLLQMLLLLCKRVQTSGILFFTEMSGNNGTICGWWTSAKMATTPSLPRSSRTESPQVI